MKLNRSWLMTLCVVGMGAIFILPALGISLGSLLGFLLILLCPLSHLLMMRGGHGSHHEPDPSPNSREGAAPAVRASVPAAEKRTVEG